MAVPQYQRAVEKALADAKEAYDEAVTAHGKDSEEAKALAEQIDSLEKEISEQQGIIDEATKALEEAQANKEAAENKLETAKENLAKATEAKEKAEEALNQATEAKEKAEEALNQATEAKEKAKKHKDDADTELRDAQSEAITDSNNVRDLTAAKEDAEAKLAAVQEAFDKVIEAVRTITGLQSKSGVEKEALEVMKQNLAAIVEKYNEAVAASDEAQKNLEDAVTAEREAENQNNTGTTTGSSSSSSSSSSSGSTSTATTSSSDAAINDVVQIADTATPLAGNQATATARRNNTTNTAGNDAVDADSDENEELVVPEVEEDEDLEMIQIEDEDTALAGEEREATTSPRTWLWGLIIALLAAAGFTTYKVAKAKKDK